MDEDEKRKFLQHIVWTLETNPDLLPDAIQAVFSGSLAAMQTLKNRTSDLDLAFRAALVLCSSTRLNAESKVQLNSVVAKAINATNAAPVEAAFLKYAEREASK